jgi:hypothetical protein
MTVTSAERPQDTTGELDDGGPTPAPAWYRPRGRRADLLAYAVYLVAAVYVLSRLWLHVHHRALGSNPHDQSFAEWMYADQANALVHLRNPFFATGQNAPLGINLMGNVATQLVSWVFAPVTLLAGPAVTFAAVTTLNLAATASAWYHVMSRHLVRRRLAAFIGAGFCGFSPGMISESNSHVHIPAQYLVPFLLLALIRLRQPGRFVRNGAILGLLIAAQLLIGEEVLFLTAFAAAVVVVCYAAMRWHEARAALVPFLGGLAVAAAVVLVVCGYPLWMQFFGPRHYRGLITVYSADLSSLVAYPTQSLGGLTGARTFVPDLAEETAFFGWPLALGATGLAVLLWRSLAARLVAVTGAVAAVLSLGPTLVWKGRGTGIPGPYRLLAHLPVFDSLITLRLALITAAAIGLLLALAVDWALHRAPAATRAGVPLPALAAVAAAAVLVPLIPPPLPVVAAPAVPRFVTSGDWRRYVAEGRTMVPVDAGDFGDLEWAVAGMARFAVPGGFTIVPRNPPADLTGVFGVQPTATQKLLYQLAQGRPADTGPAQQQAAVADLRYLRADAVVLAATPTHSSGPVLDGVSALLGHAPERVDDVYVWRTAGG